MKGIFSHRSVLDRSIYMEVSNLLVGDIGNVFGKKTGERCHKDVG